MTFSVAKVSCSIAGAFLTLLALSGCSPLSPVNRPVETATVETVLEPVVTGDAAKILTEIDNRIAQTTNELWPWVVLLLGLGALFLVGCPLVLFALAWLVRRWIASNSYISQYERIEQLKAKTRRGVPPT